MNTYEEIDAGEIENEAIQVAAVAMRFLAGIYENRYLASKRYPKK